MDHLPDSLLVALGKAPIRQVLHGVETATLGFPEHGEVEIAWERYATHSRCVFATEGDAIRFALGVGHPYLDLRDALAIMLTNHAFSHLPRGKAITERTIINAFFRAMAPFVYRARREMHEAGLTPSTSPPYVPNIDTDRSQQEEALAWANHIRERLTEWWSEIRPLFVAAEVGDLPQDERLRGRLFGIARVKRFIDPIPADPKVDLANVVQRVKWERKRRGRPEGNLDAADVLTAIHAHDDPRKVFVDARGILRFNALFVADKTRHEAERPLNDRLKDHAETDRANAEELRILANRAQAGVEDLEALERLDLADRLGRLDAKDRRLVEEALALDLGPEEWGSREHHRAATDRGYARDRKTLKRRMTRILDRLRRPA